MSSATTRVEAVVCGGCGMPIPITRDNKPNRCGNPHCIAPDEIGKRRLLELWEMERAFHTLSPRPQAHGLEQTQTGHPAQLSANGSRGRSVDGRSWRRQM